jgi:membrane protease subunit (stomatin/prohibitin family)
MPDIIEFVKNYTDHSTDNGFQYEFHCDRCGSGFRTKFKPWAIATATNVADAVGGMLGGIFGKAADLGNRVKSAAWEKAHDEAYISAVAEIKPEFIQCPRCSSWVCRKSCWNTKKGLCKNDAPDLGVEMAAAQASKSVEEVWAHAKMAEEDKHLTESDWREGIRATCPKCEAPLAGNLKFCPECGAKLKEKAFCGQCGATMEPGSKFCPECGAKCGEK